jgi:hypothetical protein
MRGVRMWDMNSRGGTGRTKFRGWGASIFL